eukprot:251846-Amphidinium_carterae.1
MSQLRGKVQGTVTIPHHILSLFHLIAQQNDPRTFVMHFVGLNFLGRAVTSRGLVWFIAQVDMGIAARPLLVHGLGQHFVLHGASQGLPPMFLLNPFSIQ